METLQRKRRVRAGHRASATRLQTEIARILSVSPAEDEKLAPL